MKALDSRLFREPLLLFLVLGVGIFALDHLRKRNIVKEGYSIEVTQQQVRRMRYLWQSQAGRLPTDEELVKLVDGHVREEILYREALRLGLDRDDVIVRRRLAQKMTFLLEDTQLVEPAEEDLRRFFHRNPGRFESPSRLTFVHIFFSSESRGEEAKDAATGTLAELEAASRGDAAPAWRSLGDPFMLGREYAERTPQELTDLFGRAFVTQLERLEVGGWQGPIASAYGSHLVRLDSRTAAQEPDFETVRPRVREEYQRQRRQAANDAAFAKLRQSYRVVVHAQDPADTRAE